MFRLDGGRPNDVRGFIHKRILGGLKGLVTGGPLGAASGFLTKPKARPTLAVGARPLIPTETAKQLGASIKFGGTEVFTVATPLGAAPGREPDCRFPKRFDRRTGTCRVFLGEESGRDRTAAERARDAAGRNGSAPMGEAVAGRYGAGLVPAVMTVDRAVCEKGMTLGDDGLCYAKGAITNQQRMWPRGRRPLLTGGDMRAIGVAARAGAKLERTTKRLRSLGLMKAAPVRRKLPAHAHAKSLPAVSI